MGLSLLKLLARPGDGGQFGYLKSREATRARRAIEQDRNRTELEIHKDWNRTLIELERERRVTTREIIRLLEDGDDYSESTIVGKRVIRKTPVPPNTLLVLPDVGGDQHTHAETIELLAKQRLPLDQPAAVPERPQQNDHGQINP